MRLSESGCWDLFLQMFPNGLDASEIIEEMSRRVVGERSSEEYADLREDLEDFTEYDPSEAVAKGLDRSRRAANFANMRESLDRAHRESVEKARVGPPPAVVQAYQFVYGDPPAGWPPS